jgi:hypothetical protein
VARKGGIRRKKIEAQPRRYTFRRGFNLIEKQNPPKAIQPTHVRAPLRR